jgi:hypothetical protein
VNCITNKQTNKIKNRDKETKQTQIVMLTIITNEKEKEEKKLKKSLTSLPEEHVDNSSILYKPFPAL